MIIDLYRSGNKIWPVFILLFVFSIQTSILAQSGSIKGHVLDKESKSPMVGANIIVEGTSLGAASDLDGNYSIRNIPVGKRIFIISYIGYNADTIAITISENKVLERNFYLSANSIEGKTVVITAQAQGQVSAIQQQLSSNTIINVVSEAKIQELPDFNAAQAISRLPGISTTQSSGEANKIVIRGLAPQFNQVTIGGVGLASTGSAQIGIASQSGTSGNINNDRSVDLSMISPYMLKNIAVYKALTPDLDANALGGIVNLELREAPSEFHADLLWQSGYTAKTKKYGNYRAVGSASDRFLDDKLGIYVLGNIESYDRNADNMNAAYFVTDSKSVGANGYLPVRVSTVQLNRHVETRNRYGANLILDYKLPSGSLKLINMASRLSSDYQDFNTILNYQTNDLGFGFRGGTNKVDVTVNTLNFSNDFGFMSFNLIASNNYSRNNLPSATDFQFTQTKGVGSSSINVTPDNLTYLVNFGGPSVTYLSTLGLYSSDYKENDQVYKGDFKIPLNIKDDFGGYIKVGGEYRYNYHYNEQNTPYASIGGSSTIQTAMNNGIVDNFHVVYDNGLARFPATSFGSLYNTSFLDNRFGQVLWTPNVGLLNNITSYLSSTAQFNADSATAVQPGGWFDGLFQTRANTYKYIEKYYATYIMSELNYGDFMVVGGVRYENVQGLYDAWNLKDGRDTKSQQAIFVSANPKNAFWLPSIQAKYSLTNWLDVRYAYTQTLARPDFHQLSPHFTINYSRNYVTSGNPDLVPAHAYNHDLIFTLHNNEIGLLSIGGFYKTIKNFTYSESYALYATAPEGFHTLSEYNIQGFQPLSGATLSTYVNSRYLAYVKGIEFDFQTRLWYLPVPFDGIVLGINYTHIKSDATYPWLDARSDYTVRPPVTQVFDSTRTGRLINQPNDIMNAYVGYDFESFSARLSFLFQGNSVTYVGNFSEQDGFAKDFFRIDASVKQTLPWYGIEVFLDLNNLNNESNVSAQKSISGFTLEQNYGLTANLGVRYRL